MSSGLPPRPSSSRSSSTKQGNGVELLSSSGESVWLPLEAVKLVSVVKQLMDLTEENEGKVKLSNEDGKPPRIPLPEVDGKTLKLVVQWVAQHMNDMNKKDDEKNKSERHEDSDEEQGNNAGRSTAPQLTEWDKKFLGKFDGDRDQMFRVANASNYMGVQQLADICCFTIATKIQNRPVEAVREYLNLENDFEPDEERQIREDTAWADPAVE